MDSSCELKLSSYELGHSECVSVNELNFSKIFLHLVKTFFNTYSSLSSISKSTSHLELVVGELDNEDKPDVDWVGLLGLTIRMSLRLLDLIGSVKSMFGSFKLIIETIKLNRDLSMSIRSLSWVSSYTIKHVQSERLFLNFPRKRFFIIQHT